MVVFSCSPDRLPAHLQGQCSRLRRCAPCAWGTGFRLRSSAQHSPNRGPQQALGGCSCAQVHAMLRLLPGRPGTLLGFVPHPPSPTILYHFPLQVPRQQQQQRSCGLLSAPEARVAAVNISAGQATKISSGTLFGVGCQICKAIRRLMPMNQVNTSRCRQRNVGQNSHLLQVKVLRLQLLDVG